MPKTRQPKRNPLDALAARLNGDAPAASDEAGPAAPAASPDYQPAAARRTLVDARVKELGLDELWLESQPREIVPEEQLQRLIAEGRAQPAALRAVLEWAAAADPYYGEVLEAIQGLAHSIASEGVLQPLEVIGRQGRYVIRDGHRRALAALMAGLTTVPAIQVAEPSELEEVAHALIVNVQRQDLTAVEKGAALLRLALLVGRRLAAERGDAAPAAVTIEALLGGQEGEPAEAAAPAGASTTITGYSRELAAAVRQRVCEMVGLKRDMYYSYLALNRLTPQARALGRRLSEKQLRPIAKAPAAYQAEIVEVAVQRGLNSAETATLARLAREGDRDEVARLLARLRRGAAARSRVSVSWESLLHAVPQDYPRRVEALRAELAALPERALQARLADIERQIERLAGLRDLFEAILAEHRPAAAPAEE
jgi:ParB-like chromosome segregation protein Spo0J